MLLPKLLSFNVYLFPRLAYKTCFQNKCQNTTRNWKCCHLGVRLAKRSYSCSVDGVISTEKYLRSLKHNIHSKTTLPKNRLFRKVRQCKRFEVCLHCCCMQQKQRMFRHRKMSNRGWFWGQILDLCWEKMDSNDDVELNLIQNVYCL